jgi:hypothetical protein
VKKLKEQVEITPLIVRLRSPDKLPLPDKLEARDVMRDREPESSPKPLKSASINLPKVREPDIAPIPLMYVVDESSPPLGASNHE